MHDIEKNMEVSESSDCLQLKCVPFSEEQQRTAAVEGTAKPNKNAEAPTGRETSLSHSHSELLLKIAGQDVVLSDLPLSKANDVVETKGNSSYRDAILQVSTSLPLNDTMLQRSSLRKPAIKILHLFKDTMKARFVRRLTPNPSSPNHFFYREWTDEEAVELTTDHLYRAFMAKRSRELGTTANSYQSKADHSKGGIGTQCATVHRSQEDSSFPYTLELIQELVSRCRGWKGTNLALLEEVLREEKLEGDSTPQKVRRRDIRWSLRQRYVSATIRGTLSIPVYSRQLLEHLGRKYTNISVGKALTVKKKKKQYKKKRDMEKKEAKDDSTEGYNSGAWSLIERQQLWEGLSRCGWGKWTNIARSVPTRSRAQCYSFCRTVSGRLGTHKDLSLIRDDILKPRGGEVVIPEPADKKPGPTERLSTTESNPIDTPAISIQAASSAAPSATESKDP